MNQQQKQRERKRWVRRFLQDSYSDQNLADALAHAQDGKMAYLSCCCLIGIPTAKHALQGRNHAWATYGGHDNPHTSISGLAAAAFSEFGGGFPDNNPRRLRILIPMIRAEMKRRAAVRALVALELSPADVAGLAGVAK